MPHVQQAVVVITTSSVEGVQGALEIVHRNVAVPGTANPVTPEVGDPGVVIVAVPDTTAHALVPTTGVFPAKVAVVTSHVGCISAPALAVVGCAFTVIVAEAEADGPLHPFAVTLTVAVPVKPAAHTTVPVVPVPEIVLPVPVTVQL